MTSACPRVAGLMSMKATVRSSSSTRVEGISPATILQNRQSGSGATRSSLTAGTPVLDCPAMYAEREGLERTVRHLAAIERPSASEGEREAAEWIAAQLRELGLDAAIEEERAHGTYWIPQALLTASGAVAGALALRGHRKTAAAIGLLAAAGIADDCSAGPHVFRKLLPHRATWNVVADAGDV